MKRRSFVVFLAAALGAVRAVGSRARAASVTANPPTGAFAEITPAASRSLPPAGAPMTGLNAAFNGYKPFPGSEWYRDVSSAPVDVDSASYLSTIRDQPFQQDGGGWIYAGATQGIPYFIVDSTAQPLVPVVMGRNAGEADVVWAPIPLRDDIVEGYPAEPVWPRAPSGEDRHVIVFDRATHVSYELYQGYRRVDHWICNSLTVWDTDGPDAQRPYGRTSSDVAGQSVLIGLLQGNQVVRDRIDHATRFTVGQNSTRFLSPPAMHAQTYSTGEHPLPFGARLRLKAATSIRGNARTQSIVAAMKKYGIINSDTGLALSTQADTYPWDSDEASYQELRRLKTSDFEVIATGAALLTQDGSYPKGAPPTASLAVSRQQVRHPGESITLTPSWTGATLGLLTPIGGAKRTQTPLVDAPEQDTWYTLSVQNPHGALRKHQRVLVLNWARRYLRPDIYVSATGSTSNDGLSAASPWPISALGDAAYHFAIAGHVIQLADGTYDLSSLKPSNGILLNLPPGVNGKPTVLQAETAGSVMLSTGNNANSAVGVYYAGLCHVQLIGLGFATRSAPFNVTFFGQDDTGLLIDTCTFEGFSTAGAQLVGGYKPSWTGTVLRNCKAITNGTSCLARLNGNANTLILGCTASGGGSFRLWEDYGGNSDTLVQ